MACKGTKVTAKEVRRMWELYQTLGSYKKVGEKMHRSPDTVSRHIAKYDAAQSIATLLR